MLKPLHDALAPVFLEKALLALNHLLNAEPVARDRLLPHTGRRIVVRSEGWPSPLSAMLPPPPVLDLRITAAGLLEAVEGANAESGADLEVVLDAQDPLALAARLASRSAPPLRISGDAALAADVSWLADNLRWDAAADLERVIGPAAALQMTQWGAAVLQGLRATAAQVQSWVGRRD